MLDALRKEMGVDFVAEMADRRPGDAPEVDGKG